MHAVYAADIMSRKPGVHPGCVVRLKQLCIDAICRHVGDMEVHTLLELPTPLIKELIPHLNIIDLERLQPALNHRGISTYLAWVTILQDVWGPHYAVDIHSEEECKEEAMDKLFRLVFYGFKNKGIIKHFPNADISSLFLVMAKYLKCFHVRPARWLCSLATEQKALLGVLERTVRRVEVKQPLNASKRLSKYVLYVLHRLLDHGAATELALHNQEPAVVQWILTARGNKLHIICTAQGGESGPEQPEAAAPQEAENVPVPRKRSRLSASQKAPPPHHQPPHHHDNRTTDKERPPTPPSSPPPHPGGSGGGGPTKTSCPRGNIRSLQVTECGHGVIAVLSPLLPTWLCLRSLSLHGLSIPNSEELSTLACCLRQLCSARGSVLSELSVGLVTDAAFVAVLLEACPTLTSLSVELHPMATPPHPPPRPDQPTPPAHPTPPHARPRRQCASRSRRDTELRLERLSVKVSSVETDVGVVTSVLKRCPHLTSLHVRGLRPPPGSSHRQLLLCVTESNRRLRNLHLEDVNLDDCLPDLLKALTTCPLEELKLRDCRLLDKFSGKKNKEKALRQLVECVKSASSLHSLSLCQNRLAKNVSTLAELFSGASQSSVTSLDISSTSIQAADLMDLARRLEQSPPARRVTLDLRRNPWDRSHRQWNVALGVLHAHCDFLMDSYRSTPDMMALTCRPGVFD